MDVAEFLGARVNEKKERVERMTVYGLYLWRIDKPFALREVAADHNLLRQYAAAESTYNRSHYGADMMVRDALLRVIKTRAVIWFDHPGYLQEWKP